MEAALRDLRHALRDLVRSPTFAVVTISTLALAIGVNVAVFTLVEGVLLRPLPFEQPDRVVRVWESDLGRGIDRGPVSGPDFADWRDECQAFESMAAWAASYFNLTARGEPARVVGAQVSPDLFDLLGVRPQRGPGFGGAATELKAAIVSDRLWRAQLGSVSDLAGVTVRIEGEPYRIVGVMPQGFRFPDDRFDLWLPMPQERLQGPRSRHDLQVVARLAAGTDLGRAQSELAALDRRLAEEHPEAGVERRIVILPILEEAVGEIRPLLLVLQASVVLLLAIALGNVANLLLARATARERDIGVRLALGARRSALVRRALAEGLLVALAGALAGLALARGAVELLLRLAPPDLPRLQDVGIDLRVLGFAAGLALLTALTFPSVPALRGAGLDLIQTLKDGARGSGSSRRLRTLRSGLVAVQIGLAFVLVTSAVLMVESFTTLSHVDPGFRTEDVSTLEVSLPATLYRDVPQIVGAYDRILDEVEALPEVEEVALTSHLPLTDSWASRTVYGEGVSDPEQAADEGITAEYRMVSGSYFETMGIPRIAGRTFGRSTDRGSEPVVVSETLARQFWGGSDAVGRRVSFEGPEGPWLTVVGVVGDVRHYGLAVPPSPTLYEPFENMPWPWATMTVVAHTRTRAMSAVPAIRDRIWSIDSELPISKTRSLEDLRSKALAKPLFAMLLLEVFAGVAVVLSAVGMYGLVSQWVLGRVHELGVRRVLGATPGSVQTLVLRQGGLLIAAGLVIGAALALALTRFLSSLLFGVGPTDLPTYLATTLGVVVIGLAACALPARRAARIAPATALRTE